MPEPVFRGLCSKCDEKVMSNQERKMDPSTKQYFHADCNAEKEKAERADKEKEKIKLTLTGKIESGRNLLALDYWSGKSDPFVRISLGDPNDKEDDVERIDETAKVMNDCNPSWDWDFKEKISFKDYEAGKHVIFRIFDWNRTSGDKAMGQVSVPLKDIPTYNESYELPVVANPNYSAKMKRDGKNRFKGQLFLSLKLTGLPENMPDVSTYKEPPPPPAQETFTSINAQAEGGQALKSEELDALAKILKIAGTLSQYGVTIDPPKIAVVGGQSAGKSTLFNVILREVGSYARFPSGRGTCTKVPTVLTLAKSGYPYVKVDGNEIKMSGLSDMDKSERVIQAIQNAQKRILEGQFPGYTDDMVVFSATPVNVVAGAPRVSTEIVIVDLPGLVQSSHPNSQDVKDMIKSQIESPNTLIVAAGKTDQDEANDEGYGLAKVVDPQGIRTLRVYTMWGISSEDRKKIVISEIRNWSATPSKQPHVVHLEPDSTGELVPARAPEVPKECQGTTMMVQKLGGQLGTLVRTTTDALQDQFERAKKKAEKELKDLGQWSGDKNEIEKKADKLSEEYVEKPIEKSTEHLHELLQVQELIVDLMQQCEDHSGNTVYEHDVSYWTKDKMELIIFQGQRACKKIIDDKINMWRDPISKFDAGIEQWLAKECTNVLEPVKKQEEPNGPLPKEVHERLLGLWNQASKDIIQDIQKELQSEIVENFRVNPGETRDMSETELQNYLYPNAMAVLCEYIQMDDQGDECQDKVNGTESILKYLTKKNPVLDDYEQIIGCASCRQVTDKCECRGENRDKWANCKCGEIQPCACGKVILDRELEAVLAHRRRILLGAKEWIGFTINSRRVGCLGRMEDKVREICGKAIRKHIGDFKLTIPKKIPVLLQQGEDPHKKKREGLENQLDAIRSGITYVKDLAGATA